MPPPNHANIAAESGYAYDVFISYRRMPFGQQWIRDEFLGIFKDRLQLELGRVPEVFWDDASVDDGEVPVEVVRDALLRSRCLLSVLSGTYFSSAWCSAEWETFRLRARTVDLRRGQTLTVPLRWHDGENYLEMLRGEGPQPSDFTAFRYVGEAWRNTPTHVKFQDAVNDLAGTIGRLLARVPAFQPTWQIVDPAAVRLEAPRGTWTFKLGADTERPQ